MAGAASAHQAATASREQSSQQRTGRTRRTSGDPQRAQQRATADAVDAPAALDSLSRLQQLANASPQVTQLRRLQALADGQFAPVAQLAGGPEEEELIQGKFATAQPQSQLQQAPRVNNTGLPDQLKSGIESLSGLSMDHVRVHYNSSQPAQLNALAYAQGNDIYLAPGQERHLPHEAWHVVQQRQGRVQATMQMAGVGVNDDVGLEREADVMGGRAQGGAVKFVAGDGQLANHAVATVETHAVQTVPVRELRVVQRLTTMIYEQGDARTKTDAIIEMMHARVPHNETQRKLAAYLSGYDYEKDKLPRSCNHYVPYASVAMAVREAILKSKAGNLGAAVTWLSKLALPADAEFTINLSKFRPYTVTVGKIPAVNIPAVGPTSSYRETVINREVNDLIFNLANDPRNLFYWPQSSGDCGGKSLDKPSGIGGMAIKQVQARLDAYRNTLQNLGLKVV